MGPMMQPPPMGAANPANLEQMAAAGDPRAIQMLQQMKSQQSGMAPPGAPPQGGMSQSQFGNSQPVPPDVAARRAKQLVEILRARGG